MEGAISKGFPRDKILMGSHTELVDGLKKIITPGMWILVKGSRGDAHGTHCNGIAAKPWRKRLIMLYDLLYPLHTDISFFNIFRYITFRTIYGGLTAFTLCFLMGALGHQKTVPTADRTNYSKRRPPGATWKRKVLPPWAGCLFCFPSPYQPCSWARLSNHYITITLLTLILFGLIRIHRRLSHADQKKKHGIHSPGKIHVPGGGCPGNILAHLSMP